MGENTRRGSYRIEEWKYFIIFSIVLGLPLLILLSAGITARILVPVYVLVVSVLAALMYVTASPTVSLKIISGKKYYNLPHLPTELLYDTRVCVENLSRFPSKVYVNLNLKSDGEPVQMRDDYCGKKPWHLYPNEGINGHFSIIDSIKQNPNARITMNIKVRNAGIYQYLIKYPTQNWRFDSETNKWYNEDFCYYR